MPRPALSASRSLDVIDFLASFPGRDFTLSEIARAAKINVASCHAVLSALTDRGYLCRSAKQKTYTLGPTLIAAGQAALKSQPLVARARDAAEELYREFGIPVLLSAAIEDEILGVVSVTDAAGRDAGLRVGERMPLVPPIGAAFVAWASPAAIEAWLAKCADPKDAALIHEWRDALALIRKRGYQVTLQLPENDQLAALMAEMSSGRQATDYKDKMIGLIGSLDRRMLHSNAVLPDALYDLQLIAAPIFDQAGAAAFSLCFGGFSEKVTGAMIYTYADRLVRTCVQIMREDRSQG
ncbi:helix-turn-helix domain-containing protein [Phenylobacterium sp. LjRoot225]|uniref:IclR family transcriptional regulator n=1 Tax=Phenylobacterium sp. LjRoot225 TaxID=3342285 RepID=UPI003ECF9E3C